MDFFIVNNVIVFYNNISLYYYFKGFYMIIDIGKTIKKTYYFSEPLIKKFEKMTRKRERSKIISQMIQEWISEREKQRLREEIIQGCHEMGDVYLEIEKEHHSLEEEVERMFHED